MDEHNYNLCSFILILFDFIAFSMGNTTRNILSRTKQKSNRNCRCCWCGIKSLPTEINSHKFYGHCNRRLSHNHNPPNSFKEQIMAFFENDTNPLRQFYLLPFCALFSNQDNLHGNGNDTLLFLVHTISFYVSFFSPLFRLLYLSLLPLFPFCYAKSVLMLLFCLISSRFII